MVLWPVCLSTRKMLFTIASTAKQFMSRSYVYFTCLSNGAVFVYIPVITYTFCFIHWFYVEKGVIVYNVSSAIFKVFIYCRLMLIVNTVLLYLLCFELTWVIRLNVILKIVCYTSKVMCKYLYYTMWDPLFFSYIFETCDTELMLQERFVPIVNLSCYMFAYFFLAAIILNLNFSGRKKKIFLFYLSFIHYFLPAPT